MLRRPGEPKRRHEVINGQLLIRHEQLDVLDIIHSHVNSLSKGAYTIQLISQAGTAPPRNQEAFNGDRDTGPPTGRSAAARYQLSISRPGVPEEANNQIV